MKPGRVAALLLLAACARPMPTSTSTSTATPTPVSPTDLGELREVVRVPAWDAMLVAGTVVVVDPSLDSLSGFAAATGVRRFRTMVPANTTGGRHTLQAGGGDLLYWAGNSMHRINAASGALLSTEAVPPNGDCSFSEEGGVCAFSCSCSVRLAACDSGKAIGSAFTKTYVEMFGPGGEAPHAGCFGAGVGLIGGGAGIAVLEVEDHTATTHDTFSRPHVIVGVDAATGKEHWRSRTLADASVRDSGVVGDRAYRGGSDGELDLFDVRDGRVLYHHAAVPVEGRVPRRLLMGDAARAELLYVFEQEAILLDTTKGATVWRTTLPPASWAVLEGSAVPSYRIGADEKPMSLLLLDRRTGAVRGRAALPPRSNVYEVGQTPPGGFYVLGKELAAFDASGTERARLATVSPPNMRAGGDWVSLFSSDELAVLDGRDLHRIARLAGSYSVQPRSSVAAQLLLYRYVDKGTKPGEAIVLSR